MYQRRSTKLRPALAPLTPDFRPPMGELSREELIAQNLDLKRITSAERRRHAAVERVFVQSLDELQSSVATIRGLYIAQVSSRLLPLPSERQAK
jgi:hypothetical protein